MTRHGRPVQERRRAAGATANGSHAPGKVATSAVPAGLPPGPSLSRTRSEGIFRRLGRTDSANHASEMEALQQALQQKGNGSHSKLLSPLPKEEDRRLPLKKWMESMKDLGRVSCRSCPSPWGLPGEISGNHYIVAIKLHWAC